MSALVAYTAEHEFAAARNAEINASLATVWQARRFAVDRNAEIDAALAAVKAERERSFAVARNAEINASLATVRQVRQFAADRNAEINAALAAVKAERERSFAAARNAEINIAFASYKAQRALRVAVARRRAEQATSQAPMETGAISIPDTPVRPNYPSLHDISADGCRDAGRPMGPLQFNGSSTTLEESMKPELDRLAVLARSCPSIRIEIHGHSAATGPVQVNRSISERRAQAAVDYLVASGVEASRISAIGHGARIPVASIETAEGVANNGRVEITTPGSGDAGSRRSRHVGFSGAPRPRLRAGRRPAEPISRLGVTIEGLAQGQAAGAENRPGLPGRSRLQQHDDAIVVLEFSGRDRTI